jgi:hypothetical protein
MKYFFSILLFYSTIINSPQIIAANFPSQVIDYQIKKSILKNKKSISSAVKNPRKSKIIAFGLCLLFGVFCVDWIIDLSNIYSDKLQPKDGRYK